MPCLTADSSVKRERQASVRSPSPFPFSAVVQAPHKFFQPVSVQAARVETVAGRKDTTGSVPKFCITVKLHIGELQADAKGMSQVYWRCRALLWKGMEIVG